MTRALLPAAVQRALRMDREEWRVRAMAELRRRGARLAFLAHRPRWRRADVRSVVDGKRLDAARRKMFADAVRAADWTAAHRALASHFAERPSVFPLDPRWLGSLSAAIRSRFPDAAADAAERGTRMLGGHYDVLGYRDVPFGTPPRWSFDPVHDRAAADAFWSDMPFLDPAHGDHKVIWEINRHQHWLALGRAYHLTGERRFYDAFVRQIGDWLAANPPLGGINWSSMLELSIRSIAWTWSLHLFASAALDPADDGTPWTVDLLVALDRQLTHVRHNLSRYSCPDTRLIGEALALYAAGRSLPELRGAAERAARGRRLLLSEIGAQIRPDGGHAGQSAHYHRYSTDFYLFAARIAQVSRDRAASRFIEAAHRQATYLRTIADADGRLPLIGDDDGGQLFPICRRPPADCRDTLATAAVLTGDARLRVGPVPEETWWLCGTADAAARIDALSGRTDEPWPSAALHDTGCFVSRHGRSLLLFDAGPHGFLDGGHAHADALSVVLTVDGRPLLIDPGTGSFTMDSAQRDRFRSTAMHNTVVVNGRMQSEPDGPFRWRTRTDCRAQVWRSGGAFDYAEGRHAAYSPLQHVRGVLSVPGIGWLVVDHLLGGELVRAELFWHVHPAWRMEAVTQAAARLCHADGTRQAIACSAPLQELRGAEAGGLDRWAPEYGRIEPAPVLRAIMEHTTPVTVVTFIPERCAEESAEVRGVPVSSHPGPDWHAAAFLVTWPDGGGHLFTATALDATGGRTPEIRAWGTPDAQTEGSTALILRRR